MSVTKIAGEYNLLIIFLNQDNAEKNDWNRTETIFFTVKDPDGLTANDSVTMTVNPVNDPPFISGLKGQSISEGNSFTAITLSDCVEDIDNPDNELSWAVIGQINLEIKITNKIAIVKFSDLNWNGIETITFIVTDPDGLTCTGTIIYPILQAYIKPTSLSILIKAHGMTALIKHPAI